MKYHFLALDLAVPRRALAPAWGQGPPRPVWSPSCVSGNLRFQNTHLHELHGVIDSWAWSGSVLLPQSCPTLCDPRDCNPPGSSVYGSLQARILKWGIFPTQGSNLGLLHCRQILYHLSYQGSPCRKQWMKDLKLTDFRSSRPPHILSVPLPDFHTGSEELLYTEGPRSEAAGFGGHPLHSVTSISRC